MPKRDEKYMQGQRDMIARAALECMLEKGLEATTLRDVASQAGISMGTLYAHFKTRDQLVLAAGSLDPVIEFEVVDNWADYEQRLGQSVDALETNERYRKITAIGYEFLGDLIRANRTVPAVEARLDQIYQFFRASLQTMQARGEISLPLGIELTVQLHIQLQIGVIFWLLSDRRLDFRNVRDGFLKTLAFTAGRSANVSSDAANQGSNETEECAKITSANIYDKITLGFPQIGTLSTRESLFNQIEAPRVESPRKSRRRNSSTRKSSRAS